MHRIVIVLAVVSLLAITGQCLCAEVAQGQQAVKKTIRMLTVGNSFADNIAHYLPQIAQAAGYQLILYRANIGGCPMEKHWKLSQIHETDSTNPEGMPYVDPRDRKTKLGLKEMLALERWDVVTIQQYSVLSADVKTYRPYAKNLYDYIKAHAPQAEVVLHQTWAYRSDDPGFNGKDKTAAVMYQGLTDAYHTIAGELGVRIVPVGDAFHLATTSTDYAYQADTTFDFTNAVYPNMPNQRHSLHRGWAWGKDKDGVYHLGMDGHHANEAGEYLGGLVFFERLTGESPVGNSFAPQGMSAEDAKILQRIAHQAVLNEVAREKALRKK